MKSKLLSKLLKALKLLLPVLYGAGLAYMVNVKILSWMSFVWINVLVLLAVIAISGLYVTKGEVILYLLRPLVHGRYYKFYNRVLPYPAKAMSIAMSFDGDKLSLSAHQAIQCDVFMDKFRDALHAAYPKFYDYEIIYNSNHGMFVFCRRVWKFKIPLLIMTAHFNTNDPMILHSTSYVLWFNIVKAYQFCKAFRIALRTKTSAKFQSQIRSRVTFLV